MFSLSLDDDVFSGLELLQPFCHHELRVRSCYRELCLHEESKGEANPGRKKILEEPAHWGFVWVAAVGSFTWPPFGHPVPGPKYSLYCWGQFAHFPGTFIPNYYNLILTEIVLYYIKCTRRACSRDRNNLHWSAHSLKQSHLTFCFQIVLHFLLRHDGTDGFGSCFFDIWDVCGYQLTAPGLHLDR